MRRLISSGSIRRDAMRLAHLSVVAARLVLMPTVALSQVVPDTSAAPTEAGDVAVTQSKVDVSPLSRDEDIQSRLQRVLKATEWFTNPTVRVEEGVVFIRGTAPTE
jgi:hypothetical protein